VDDADAPVVDGRREAGDVGDEASDWVSMRQ